MPLSAIGLLRAVRAEGRACHGLSAQVFRSGCTRMSSHYCSVVECALQDLRMLFLSRLTPRPAAATKDVVNRRWKKRCAQSRRSCAPGSARRASFMLPRTCSTSKIRTRVGVPSGRERVQRRSPSLISCARRRPGTVFSVACAGPGSDAGQVGISSRGGAGSGLKQGLACRRSRIGTVGVEETGRC